VVSREPRVEVVVETDHVSAGRLENVVREWCHVHRAIVDPPAYGAAVVLTVRLRPRDLGSFEQLVAAETSGAALPEVLGWHVTDILP
jgi:hypothetical protein